MALCAAMEFSGAKEISAAPAIKQPVTYQPIGDASIAAGGWKGFQRGGVLALPGEAVFSYSQGSAHWEQTGIRIERAGTSDWRDFYGLQFEVKVEGVRPLELTASIRIPEPPAGLDLVRETKATALAAGAGWHTVMLPWSSFDFPQAQPAFLRFIQEVRLSARFTEGKPAGKVTFRAVRLVSGDVLALNSEVRGRAAKPGETVEYSVNVGNCTDAPQSMSLAMEKRGRETMTATVEPSTLQLAPGEIKTCFVRVTVPTGMPAGAREEQILRAIPNGDGNRAARLTFTTASFLPHPYLVHTGAEWQEVREKAQDHAWAKQALDALLKQSGNWTVPEIKKALNGATPFLFEAGEESNLLAAACSWQLAHDTNSSAKVALFLTRLANPANGYPMTARACNGSLTDEGLFMQHCAMAFDMVLDSGVLTDFERIEIGKTLRLFIEEVRLRAETGGNDHETVAQICGALYASLAIQDLNLAARYLSGPAGIMDQISNGIMDDGWWHEYSIPYNLQIASEFSQAALAVRPWGINLVDGWIPASASGGVAPQAARNFTSIKRMWDALPPFADYRGNIFGLNDSTEQSLAGDGIKPCGNPFELACFLYHDPAYAAIIKQSGHRDLIYGLAELPEMAADNSGSSAHADNVGLAMLRSQSFEPGERIEAVLHYGEHGGPDAHFDHTSLLALQRYGKSFYNPESIWYGTDSFMHGFYVQSSMSANMVVVDGRQQEPVESPRLLFFRGEMMQVAAVGTDARWNYPPFGGTPGREQANDSMAEIQWREGRSFPIPADAPAQGETGTYSDRVLQRRLMIVMPDYVVLADYLKAPQPHTFDNLFQIKGFTGLNASDKKLIRHDPQMTADARSAAQFITDCDWYSASAPSRATFNDTNSFRLDVLSLWPAHSEIMVGNAPEMQPVNKQVSYAVRGDGKTLREGKLAPWILGRAELDMPVDGVAELQLETSVTNLERNAPNSLYWGNPRIVLADGSETPLADLPVRRENLSSSSSADEDYFGKVVKIAGEAFDSVSRAEPEDKTGPAVLHVDLRGLKATRFRATLGGDYPVGNDTQHRKTYAIRCQGTEARYLTLLEPREKESVIRKAEAFGSSRLRVELTDGRVQEFEIRNLDGDGANIVVRAQETRNGNLVRSEATDAAH